MPFLFLLLAFVAGAFVGWMSVLGGIWFTMPIFLVCGAIVSIALDRAFRWRLAAFSVGLFAVLALQASAFVRDVNEAQHKAVLRLEQEKQKQTQK